MSDLARNSTPHIKLFIPGPTEVRPEILDAQTRWMIGHRMPECATLFHSIQEKIRPVFYTQSRVYINAASGTGLQEAAIRNCVKTKVLNCVNGAFSKRWKEVTEANGKANEVLNVAWGQPILPEQVVERLATGEFDAVTIVHNETSTGVTSDVKALSEAIRALPNGQDISILIDSVSGLSGARIEFDAWDLDVVLTSSQKAFALPAGLSFCAVSDRALAKAKTVPARGLYFDFVDLEKYLVKDQTPATPAISLMYALDKQLEDMMSEGMENRFARHLALRVHAIAWAKGHGFNVFAAPGYESPTMTCVENNLGISVSALNKFLRTKGMVISSGYGDLKDSTFRIAHMGDTQMSDLEELLANMDEFLAQA